MDWFAARGLSDGSLFRHQIGFDNAAITIPIFDAQGEFLFLKYRRSPLATDGPKYWYDKGGAVSLYNIEQLAGNEMIVICEGEFDCLILEEHGIPAVTSTGGAMSFKEEWIPLFADKKIFICLDNDDAGRKGAWRIAKMLPGSKIMALPTDIGEHGDVTDFFVKLGRDTQDFKDLCTFAYVPEFPAEPKPAKRHKTTEEIADDVAAAKSVPMRELVNTPVTVKGFTKCPFHNEKTASFRIFPDNHAHCFGCDWHGDSIDYLMKTQNLTFKEAVKSLLKSV